MEGKRVLITGANGKLGSRIVPTAQALGCNYQFFKTSLHPNGPDTDRLDVTRYDEVVNYCREHRIDIAINCAGYTKVDVAESEQDRCKAVNVGGAANAARAMAEVNGTVVHISTDYVFGDSKFNEPIREDETMLASSAYGKSKIDAENAVRSLNQRHIIIRSSWLFDEYSVNFMTRMIAMIENGDSVPVVSDQYGSPTYIPDLAGAIVKIIGEDLEGKYGTYHFSNSGTCSWYEYATEIETVLLSCKGGMGFFKVKPCLTSEWGAKAKRPAYSALDCTKIHDAFGIDAPDWRSRVDKSVVEYLRNRR